MDSDSALPWALRAKPAVIAPLLAAHGAVEGAMVACGACFAAWAQERVPGVFNASATASTERGAAAYNCMGHGTGGTNFAVVVALRELLQNSYDAGATAVEVRSLSLAVS